MFGAREEKKKTEQILLTLDSPISGHEQTGLGGEEGEGGRAEKEKHRIKGEKARSPCAPSILSTLGSLQRRDEEDFGDC